MKKDYLAKVGLTDIIVLTFTDHLRFEIANENLLWKQKFAQYRGMKWLQNAFVDKTEVIVASLYYSRPGIMT